MANNTTQLTMRLLGAPEARISGAPLILHDHKAKALLYYLAATGRPHTRDYLATFLWSESPGSNARHSLRSSLYHIRQALHVKGSEGALAGDGDLVYLKLDHYDCDLARFCQLLKAGNESALVEAVSAHRLTGNISDLCATLFELGNVAAQRGELRQALEHYQEAARTAERTHTHYFLALAHNNFAYHSLLLGRLAAAQQALAKGNTLAETYEMSSALLPLTSTQGEIQLYLGEWAAASAAFQQGLTLAEELGNLERQAGHRAGLGLAARGQHNLEVATTLLEVALTLIRGRGYWHLHTRIQLWLAETLLLREHITEAEPHILAALQTAQAHGRRLLLMQGERLHACLLATRNNWPAANALFTTMLERASNLGLSLEIARTQAIWGETLLRYSPGDNHGHALLMEARKVFTEHDARAELNALMVGMKL